MLSLVLLVKISLNTLLVSRPGGGCFSCSVVDLVYLFLTT